ncbi:exostosin family protein [Wolffia australiana]
MKKPSARFIAAIITTFFFLAIYNFVSFSSSPQLGFQFKAPQSSILKIYVADLPRSLNYGLLEKYWSISGPDSRIGFDPDEKLRVSVSRLKKSPLPYPESPLIKQYSAEYWLLRDLEAPAVVERVGRVEDADVVFVPFFATLSAELELGWGRKGGFGKKEGNEDYARQREVVDLIVGSDAWNRSGGRDHVFVLTDPVAMWHVREEIAPAILLVVDFGGWFKLDDKSTNEAHVIQHNQVSLLKDIIVPYTHLLPTLSLSEDQPRNTLLYFKGAKHRHRGGIVREKLWDLLVNEPGVVMEEGFPNATGLEQSIRGIRSSEFCLHPAGDTPTSCRLFDAIASLCIPVIVSDQIELPFEGIIDYSEIAVFVSVADALQPRLLVDHLRSFSSQHKRQIRRRIADIQPIFEYESVGVNGAVEYIWRKLSHKVPMIKEAAARKHRKPPGTEIPLRCLCT